MADRAVTMGASRSAGITAVCADGARRIARATALACAPLAGLVLLSLPVRAAQEIVLRLTGSDFEIGGELRAYDGRRYRVATMGFGELSLDAGRYTCVTGACPETTADTRQVAAAGHASTLELAGPTGAKPARIVLDGAPALESDLLPALVRGYARHLGGTAKQLVGIEGGTSRFQIADARGAQLADIVINRRATNDVLAALVSGAATLGATSRAIAPAEFAAVPNPVDRDGLAAHETVLGLDGLVVIVSPGSPAKRLAAADVARILTGEVRDWSQVGLAAGPIQVYAGEQRVPATLAAVLGRPRGLTLSTSAKRIADEAELSDAVARDPSGIGIASLSQLRNARSLDVVLGCGITSRASEFAVKTEEYPLVRRAYLYTKGQPAEPLAQELVRFAVSPEAQASIREGGLVDQSIVIADDAGERARLAEAQTWTRGGQATRALAGRLAEDVATSHRLSTTLRFQLNSSDLDVKARGDIRRLARLLRQPDMQGRTVMLAGFTDASGPADVNAALSLKRAQEVRQALLDAMAADASSTGAARVGGAPGTLPAIEARGYGPAAPIACNGGSPTQHRNRRVEVWVRQAGAADAVPSSPDTMPAPGRPVLAGEPRPLNQQRSVR